MTKICWTPLELHTIFQNIEIELINRGASNNALQEDSVSVNIIFIQDVINDCLSENRRRYITSSSVYNIISGYYAWHKSKNLSDWWPYCSTHCFHAPGKNVKKAIEEWNDLIQGNITIDQLKIPYRLTIPSFNYKKRKEVNLKKQKLVVDLKEQTPIIPKIINNSPSIKSNEDIKIHALIKDPKFKQVIESMVKEEINKQLSVIAKKIIANAKY